MHNNDRHRPSRRVFTLSTIVIVALQAGFALPLYAQELHHFDVKTTDSAAAIREFGRQSGVHILAAADTLAGKKLNRLSGDLETNDAFQILLAGTGLSPRYVGNRAVALVASNSEPSHADVAGNDVSQERSMAGGATSKGDRRIALTQETSNGNTPGRSAGASPEPDSNTGIALEEIIVTARKKSAGERAQDVPISLTAISGNQIEASFAKDLTDIGQSMPNVRLDTAGVFPGTANYAIRGMGFVSSIASTEPTVGVIIDGMYLGTNLGGALDAYDLESVEVLRGPQGTLFGRNVTGGAVVVKSRRPTGDFGLQLRTGAGSGGRWLASGAVEGPIASTLAGKLYAQYSDRDGDFNNIALGKKFGAETNVFVRPTLRWRPNDDLDITLIGEYGRTTGDGAPARVINDPSTLATRSNFQVATRVDDIALNDPGDTRIRWTQGILEADWSVGTGAITSISGYRDVAYFAQSEDGSGAEIVNSSNWLDQHQISEELRYADKAFDNRLDYTVGLYYFDQKLEQRYRLDIFGRPTFLPAGTLQHHAASAFAQGDYSLMDRLTLTAGLRYNWEKKSATIARGNNCSVDFICTFPFQDSNTWDDVSPKVGINWQASEQILTYLSWTKGFRSGGYNTRTTGATESPGPYDAETVKAFELGVKSEFFDRTLRLNGAVFHNKYDNLQRSVFDPTTFSNSILNAAAASIDGAELELVSRPTRNLTLSGSLGYTDATYDSFKGLDINGDGRADAADEPLAKGLQLVRAPRWTWSTAADYDIGLGDAGTLTTRVSYSHTSSSPLNDADTWTLDGYGLLDASLTWRTLGEHFKVSLWGKNITNELYGLTGAKSALFTNIYQSLPRTYGVEFAYKY